ncbi:hypothetical protein OX284_005005 [Flavobacterium sp. SUN046]|uniref:hypothetical protein n=1 Tax=Flavobacterium sp. SUN046 TaxID=3002440 RepID=UPI002DB5933D|nr:hypothetical protein [Flavobacterium sp. SUN046]MEC4048780.1 hypothetical protein [Flavobacterium sp. SUN046]
MTRYELLKANEDTMYQFIKAGILSFQIIRDIEIFESFNSYEDGINKESRYLLLADSYELSPKRIEQIVYQMNK